jgi:hypothetical protein
VRATTTQLHAGAAFRLVVALGIVLALAISIALMLDWHGHRPTSDQRVVFRQVVAREMAFVGPLRRPLLTIRATGVPDTVKAILLVNSSSQVPDAVSFYAPARDVSDVQLLEETSSLTAAIVGFGLCLACVGLLVFAPVTTRRRLPE